MKKIIFIVFFMFLFCSFVYADDPLPPKIPEPITNPNKPLRHKKIPESVLPYKEQKPQPVKEQKPKLETIPISRPTEKKVEHYRIVGMYDNMLNMIQLKRLYPVGLENDSSCIMLHNNSWICKQ